MSCSLSKLLLSVLQGDPELGIIRQFTFSSSLQRMSVIVKELNSTSFDLYVKVSVTSQYLI